MRRDVDHPLDPQGAAHRDLLEMPPVLHGQTEARRLGRPHRPFHAEVREGRREEIMSLRSSWSGAAKLLVGAFNATMNGLTASTGGDRNVDMLIGGQAVLEGVTMRSLTGFSVAVRQPNGGVAIKKEKLAALTKKYPFLKLPVLRGSVALIQSLILGMRALNYSASVATEGESGEQELSSWAIAGSLLMALVVGIGIFILVPLGLTNLIRHYLLPGMGNIAYHAIDGLLGAVLFFGDILPISRRH